MSTRARLAFAGAIAATTCVLLLAPISPLAGASVARPQPAAGAEPGPLAKTPAAGLVGEWAGTSWSMGRDGLRHEGRAVERARWNLAGTAIIVEGYGYTVDEATGARTTRHDAAGLIELDAATDEIAFYARRAGAAFAKHTLEVNEADGTMRWSPDSAPGVDIRFTISLADGRWREIGEMSRDGGATWTTFLGTDLERTPSGGE
jgi:hypothetical protein